MKTETYQVSKLKPMWFPEPWQIIRLENPSYFNSLFLGLINPLWNMPTMIWTLLLFPIIRGLFYIVRFTVCCMLFGIFGRILALPIPQPGFTIVLSKQPPEDTKAE